MTLTKSCYEDAKELIPGGVQLLSKRPEMFAPGVWPAFYSKAEGCEVWDLDGRHYYDMSTNAVGSCLLGFADPAVNRAVKDAIDNGSMSSLNAPEDVELARRLLDLHPWAEKARFARTGGEIAAIAVRIARATTGRTKIAVCGYHGWHDWYLAANLGENDALKGHHLPGLEPQGVPPQLRGTTLTFRYNRVDELKAIVEAHGDDLAAIVMEPCRHADPAPGFLESVRDAAHAANAILIFDEITIAWRTCYGGAHTRLGVNPDMAIFAKALGNGFPIAAVIGTSSSMDGCERSFISSTYWTERMGPCAALAVLDRMERTDVPAAIAKSGAAIAKAWRNSAGKYGLPVSVPNGYPCLVRFSFDHEKGNALRTIYARLMLRKGFLGGQMLYGTLAHDDEVVSLYSDAIDDVFAEIAEILSRGDIEECLGGEEAHTGFRRLL